MLLSATRTEVSGRNSLTLTQGGKRWRAQVLRTVAFRLPDGLRDANPRNRTRIADSGYYLFYFYFLTRRDVIGNRPSALIALGSFGPYVSYTWARDTIPTADRINIFVSTVFLFAFFLPYRLCKYRRKLCKIIVFALDVRCRSYGYKLNANYRRNIYRVSIAIQRVRFRTAWRHSLLFGKIAAGRLCIIAKRTDSRPIGFHVYRRCTTVTAPVLGNRQCCNKLNIIILKTQTTHYRARGRWYLTVVDNLVKK